MPWLRKVYKLSIDKKLYYTNNSRGCVEINMNIMPLLLKKEKGEGEEGEEDDFDEEEWEDDDFDDEIEEDDE